MRLSALLILLAALTFAALGASIGPARAQNLPAGNLQPRYSYFYHGRVITLQQNPDLVVFGTDARSRTSALRAGLARTALSDHYALQRHGLTLLAVPRDAARPPAERAPGVVRSSALSPGVMVQPVFDDGDMLAIPGDEVIVGFRSTTTLAQANRIFQPLAAAQGIVGVRPFWGSAFIVRISAPEDGRAFPVSRFLAGLAPVRYAEPNLILIRHPDSDPAPPPLAPMLLPPPNRLRTPAAPPLRPAPGASPARVTTPVRWRPLLDEHFETAVTGAVPGGWTTYVEGGHPDASPAVTAAVHRSGEKSLHLTGGGNARNNVNRPYALNCLTWIETPALDLKPYAGATGEAYVEWWFRARYDEASSPAAERDLAAVVFSAPAPPLVASVLLVNSGTPDLTLDPTTAEGWRRGLLRVPPRFRTSGLVVRFGFLSNNFRGAADPADGVFVDDVRVVATDNVDVTGIGNDPYGARQYELNNAGQIAGLGNDGNDMNLPEAWALQPVSPNIVLAILDNGVELRHPDLNFARDSQGILGFDADTNRRGGGPRAGLSPAHGTECAGNAGAIRNNGIGVIGTAPGVKIMPIHTGAGTDYWANAYRLAVQNHAKIISNSEGIAGPLQTVEDAIRDALAAQVTVLVAAGNGPDRSPFNYEVNFPAQLTGADDPILNQLICVGATSPTDEYKGAASSDGEFFWGSSFTDPSDLPPEYGNAGPDVCAPGPWSYTTDLLGDAGSNRAALGTGIHPDYTHNFNGTSSATPKVAGVAALLLSRNPDLTPGQVKRLLINTAKDIDAPGWDDRTGFGRVDAAAAVQAAAAVPFSITGMVYFNGHGQPNVTVTATPAAGGQASTAKTAGNGSYTINNLPPGLYTVAASFPDFAYTPAKWENLYGPPNLSGINFTGRKTVFSLRGAVMQHNSALPEVLVTATRVDGVGAPITTRTATNGTYGFDKLPEGEYKVTPAKTDFAFEPPTATVSGPPDQILNFTGRFAKFNIFGQVTGPGRRGATVTATPKDGRDPVKANTRDDGTYSILNLPEGEYTVTVFQVGFDYLPESREVEGGPDKNRINFDSDSARFEISGRVMLGLGRLPQVKVRAGGVEDFTDGDGRYRLRGLTKGTYNVTATRPGFDIVPRKRRGQVTVPPDQVNVDFTAQPSGGGGPTFTVRGTVNHNGTGLPDVWVTAAGRAVETDADGKYTLTGIPGGTYLVTPFKTNFTFTPPDQRVTLGPNRDRVDFTASDAKHSIRGKVLVDGTGQSGVTVTANPGNHTTMSLGDGTYLLAGLPAGSYTVSAAKSKFAYKEAGFENPLTVGPDRSRVNFVGESTVFFIRGTVSLNGSGQSGVTVTAAPVGGGPARTATTAGSGIYTLTDLPKGTYVVSAAMAKFAYTPTSTTVKGTVDRTGVNFTARPTVFSIRGEVTRGSSSQGGVTVTATGVGGDTFTTTTAANGVYGLDNLPEGAYTLIATKRGLVLAPDGFTNPVSGPPDRIQINFAALPISAAEFRLHDGTVQPGATVTLPLEYTDNGASVNTAVFDLLFDASKVSLLDGVPVALPPGVEVTVTELAPGRVRVLIFGQPDGPSWSSGIVAAFTFRAAVGVGPGTTTLVDLVLPDTPVRGVRVTSPAGVTQPAASTGSTLQFFHPP